MTLPLVLSLLGCGTTESEPTRPPPPPATSRPNFVLVTLDTTRRDVIDAYAGQGKSRGRVTPNLSRLASEGVRFDRAYTVTPLTIPAHSSLFTGMYPPRHGVRDNGDYYLDDGAVTLAEQLSASGYQTVAAVGAEVTSHHWGFAQGFGSFFDDMGSNDEKNRWRVERPGGEVLADARGWLEQNSANTEPFFLWMHLFDPHHPYTAPESFEQKFPGRRYLAEVSYSDSLVGQLVDTLEALNKLDNTWVFVMADHGEGLGSHGEAMHGVLLYNATTHIPMIVRPPKPLDQTRPVDAPVSLVDVAPTILSLAGVTPESTMDGADLTPWLLGEGTPTERGVYLESLYAYRHYGWAPQKALVTPGHKYIHSTTPELYAHTDPGEASNLSTDDTATLKTHRDRLGALVEQMEPIEGLTGAAQMSADRLAQLAALGYVTAVGDLPDPTDASLPDPVERLPVLRELEGARQALQSGDVAEAQRLAEAVLQKEPNLNEAQAMLAGLLSRSGELDRAIAILNELDERTQSATIKVQLGSIHLSRGEMDLATSTLAQAIELDPFLATAWVPHLHALFMKGDLPGFEAAIGRGRTQFPESNEIAGLAGFLEATKGNYDAAEPLLRGSLEANPTQPFLNHGLAIVHKTRGETERAESHLLEEIRLFNPAIPSRRLLVEVLAEQGRYEEQLEQLDTIAKIEPPTLLTTHSLAQAHFNVEHYTQAEQLVDQCVEMAPKYPACLMLRANVLKKLGREDEAQKAYEYALQVADERLGK